MLPNLGTTPRFVGPSQRKKRTNSFMLFSDIHTHVMEYMYPYTHHEPHMHTHTNRFINKKKIKINVKSIRMNF